MAITMKSLQFTPLLLAVLCLSSFVAGADLIKFKGENVAIKCQASKDDLGISLFTRREVQREVMYFFFNTKKLNQHKDFNERIKVSSVGQAVTIDILNLQTTDTGAYWCMSGRPKLEIEGTGVFLLIHEKESAGNMAASKSASQSPSINDLLIPVTALTICSVLFFSLLVLGVWLVPKLKKIKNTTKEEKKGSNGVYEVMTVTQRNELR